MAVGREHGSFDMLPIQSSMTLEFFFEATGEGNGESACGDCKNQQRAMYSYSYYIGTKTDGSGKMT